MTVVQYIGICGLIFVLYLCQSDKNIIWAAIAFQIAIWLPVLDAT